VKSAGAVMLLALALAPSWASASAPTNCAGFGWQDACTVNSGSQVDIVGQQNSPGGPGAGGGGGGGGGGWAAPGPGAPAPPPVDREVAIRETSPEFFCPDCTLDVPPAEEPEEADENPGLPAVTAADLASFAPARPALGGEPAGAGVVGMPVNFVAGATAQTPSGSLFGRAVTVRFTPVAYVFDYGDGSTARSTSAGASWADLGQPQFSATPTSHAYAERGTYTVSVTVEYAAEVDFGTGWYPVSGVVTSTTGGYDVEIFEVRTALVAHTCAENPAGPGC
jgi:hypothetical protein